MNTDVVITSTGEPVEYVDASGAPRSIVQQATREIASQLTQWVAQGRVRQGGSMFSRSAYVSPDNPYAQMKIARNAMSNDDIVGGLADSTEGLIFQGVQWESSYGDEADIFNQMSARLDMDDLLRQAYRTLYTDSQVVFASWWDWQEFKLRGRNSQPVQQPDGTLGVSRGPRRRKSFRVWCPTRVTILDSLRVVPVGNRLWGYDRLAWQSSKAEIEAYERAVEAEVLGLNGDATMTTLFTGQYRPDKAEAASLGNMGVDPDYLLELNPDYVWRHTLTKPSHALFPEVRLASIFKLLDLKQQLMEADRVNLIGAANYLLLVKKGDEKNPAYPEELANLRENFETIARLPVIISDHRLNIEIITPAQDVVLNGQKYDTLDRRILSRIIGSLSVGTTNQSRGDATFAIARGIGRLLENRRHMIKRTFEANVARKVVDHPLNAGIFNSEPNLAYTPRNVQLDADSQIVQAVLALRTQKEISRKSLLEYFGFDQEVEAQRREIEEVQYDPIFKTIVPFTSPALNDSPVPPQVSGAQGGRPNGGGDPPQNAANPQPRNRTPRQRAQQGQEEEATDD